MSQDYVDSNGHLCSVRGEIVKIELRQDRRTLAQASWVTLFKQNIYSCSLFWPAKVSGADLMKQLLQLGVFTHDDLVELIHSYIPEVRIGAAANLTDQAVLAQTVIEDQNSDVRDTAIAKLTDKALLAKVASEATAQAYRQEARRRIAEPPSQTPGQPSANPSPSRGRF
jgi:hypothetical protein